MAKWNNTTFYEFIQGPSEQYSQDSGRIVRYLDVPNATVAVREQAVADFLGWQKVVTVNKQSGGGSLRYITRSLPMSYAWATTQPAQLPNFASYYATTIIRGEPLTPKGTSTALAKGNNIAVGGNFDRYRFTVEFTEPTYDLRTDNEVAANEGADATAGFLPPSPLYDTSGANPVGYPDEGQWQAGIAFFDDASWPTAGQAWPEGKPSLATGSRYITRTGKTSVRTITVPFGMVRWNSDGVSVREGSPFNEALGQFHYTWHFVPEAGIPLFAINQQLGTLNADWFDGFAPNTLLFKSWDYRRFKGPLGDILYHIEYIFSWLPHAALGTVNPDTGQPTFTAGRNLGWNFQIRCRPSTQTVTVGGKNLNRTWLEYDHVVDTPGPSAASLYAALHFDDLFRPDQP